MFLWILMLVNVRLSLKEVDKASTKPLQFEHRGLWSKVRPKEVSQYRHSHSPLYLWVNSTEKVNLIYFPCMKGRVNWSTRSYDPWEGSLQGSAGRLSHSGKMAISILFSPYEICWISVCLFALQTCDNWDHLSTAYFILKYSFPIVIFRSESWYSPFNYDM